MTPRSKRGRAGSERIQRDGHTKNMQAKRKSVKPLKLPFSLFLSLSFVSIFFSPCLLCSVSWRLITRWRFFFFWGGRGEGWWSVHTQAYSSPCFCLQLLVLICLLSIVVGQASSNEAEFMKEQRNSSKQLQFWFSPFTLSPPPKKTKKKNHKTE